MKTLFLFLFTVCFIGAINAQDKIYQIGGKHAIVADDQEWQCAIDKTSSCFGIGPFVYGVASQFPMTFECHSYNRTWTNVQSAFSYAQTILFEYARKKNMVFTNVHLKEDGQAKFYTFDGIYFDNNQRGSFLMYLSNENIMMLIKFKGSLLDTQSRDLLCKKAISLITPLVSSSK